MSVFFLFFFFDNLICVFTVQVYWLENWLAPHLCGADNPSMEI